MNTKTTLHHDLREPNSQSVQPAAPAYHRPMGFETIKSKYIYIVLNFQVKPYNFGS